MGFQRPCAALLAAALVIAEPSCGAPVVHRIPENFQDHSTVVEGTVLRTAPVHQTFMYTCGERDPFGLADWERVQVRVTKVWLGYVAGDTLSVLRPTGAGHGLSGVKPGQRVLAFGTSFYCDADGALIGRIAAYDGWRSRYVFEPDRYRVHGGDVLIAIPRSEQRDQVASRSEVHDVLRRLQTTRQQEALLAPAAIVAVVVRGITARINDCDVRCEPIATLAGVAVDSAGFTLHFVGNSGRSCGDGVFQGDTLICPLATIDPPTVSAGHCPEEFRDGGGIIRAYRVPRDRVASLFVPENGRLAFRPR